MLDILTANRVLSELHKAAQDCNMAYITPELEARMFAVIEEVAEKALDNLYEDSHE